MQDNSFMTVTGGCTVVAAVQVRGTRHLMKFLLEKSRKSQACL
jgi:hypothetical protein